MQTFPLKTSEPFDLICLCIFCFLDFKYVVYFYVIYKQKRISQVKNDSKKLKKRSNVGVNYTLEGAHYSKLWLFQMSRLNDGLNVYIKFSMRLIK